MSKIEQFYDKLQLNKFKMTQLEMENEAIENYMVTLAKENVSKYIYVDILKVLSDESTTKEQKQKTIKVMLFDKYLKDIDYNFVEDWVIYEGYGYYAVEFYFNINDKSISVQIPIAENIDVNNIKKVNYSKFEFSKIEGCIHTVIYADFDLTKVMDELKEYVGVDIKKEVQY